MPAPFEAAPELRMDRTPADFLALGLSSRVLFQSPRSEDRRRSLFLSLLFSFFSPLAVSYFRSGSLQRSIFVFSSFRISPPPMNDSESVVLTSMRLSVYRLPFSITYLAAMRDAFLSAVEDRRKREANRRQAVAAAKPNHSSSECSRRRMPPEARL